MAEDELKDKKKKIKILENNLLKLLIPKDVNDKKNYVNLELDSFSFCSKNTAYVKEFIKIELYKICIKSYIINSQDLLQNLYL